MCGLGAGLAYSAPASGATALAMTVAGPIMMVRITRFSSLYEGEWILGDSEIAGFTEPLPHKV